MMMCRWRGLAPGILLLLVILPRAGAQEPADGGLTPYDEALREKVGEVAEIRYRALAEAAAPVEGAEASLFRIALYRYMQGDYAGAEHYLRQLILRAAGTPLEWEARLWLGRTHSARGEQSAALVELRGGLRALQEARTGDDVLIGRYLFWIGEAHLRAGDAAEAKDRFEELFEGYPGHPLSVVVLQRLRDAYAALGLTGEVGRVEGLIAGIREGETGPGAEARRRRGRFGVQVASFASSGNARNLADVLGTMGWDAEVREAHVGSRTRYRVRIEGLEDRKEAERVADVLRGEGFDCTIIEE